MATQQQEFNYSPVNSGVSTQPVIGYSSTNYFSRKSKAVSDVEDILGAVGQVSNTYGEIQTKQNKISKDEASLKLLNIKLEAQEKLNKVDVNDINSINSINDFYKTQSQSILDGSELTDEHRNALTMSVNETAGTIGVTTSNLIKKTTDKRTLEGVASSVTLLMNNPVDDTSKTVYSGLKLSLQDTGMTDFEAEEYLTKQYAYSKLATINQETTTVNELDSLLKESDKYIKDLINPNMINKESHLKFKQAITQLKDGISKDETYKLTQYADNENTSLKAFKDMVEGSKATGALDKITADNLIQRKSNALETKWIREQAKKDVTENKIKQEQYRDLQAIVSDPLRSEEEKNMVIQQALDKGIISSAVAGNFASGVIVDRYKAEAAEAKDKASTIKNINKAFVDRVEAVVGDKLADKDYKFAVVQQAVDLGLISTEKASNWVSNIMDKEYTEAEKKAIERQKAITLQQKQVIEDVKTAMKTTTAGIKISPDEFKALVNQVSSVEGNTVSETEQKLIAEFKMQYLTENDPATQATIYSTYSQDWISELGAEGKKKAINNTVSAFYNLPPEQFNPKAITEVYNRHELTGNIATAVKKELANQDNAIIAVKKFTSINQVDPLAARGVYGDETYALLSSLSDKLIKDPRYTGKGEAPFILPDIALIEANKLMKNPNAEKLDDASSNIIKQALKENPELNLYYDKMELSIKLGNPVEDVLDMYSKNIENRKRVPNFLVMDYPGNVSVNDARLMKEAVQNVQLSNKVGTGVAYNQADGLFYYSTLAAVHDKVITKPDANGTEVPIRVLSEVINFLTRDYKYKYTKDDNPFRD